MIHIKISKLNALRRLSDIGELYLQTINLYQSEKDMLERFIYPVKVIFGGTNDKHVGFKIVLTPDGLGHQYLLSINLFTGQFPALSFVADDVWKEIFEDL